MCNFPRDFLWGVACAAYQCEGGWNAEGKGPSIWDDFCHDRSARHILDGSSGDVACDSYHRFREDVALMKAHNIRAYRFSVSWARVIPNGAGEVNEAGLAYYDALIDELLRCGIEPLVTIYHWDLPSALQDRGGWLNREIVDNFARYAELLAGRFRGRVTKYMTLNEPQCVTLMGYGTGEHAPGWKLGEEKLAQIYHPLCLAHSAAYRAIKAICGDAVQVGVVSTGRLCYPEQDTPENREAAYRESFRLGEKRWAFSHGIFLDPLCLGGYDESAPEPVRRFAETIDPADWKRMEKPDFLGLNIYHGDMVDAAGSPVEPYPGFPRTAMKWKITPEVLRYGPLFMARRYGLPMYITENGLSCNDFVQLDGAVRDPERIDFLRRYLRELSKGIAEGADVRGYLHWSFLDNFEWAQGYTERFGLVYVDYRTSARVPKDSARWYAGVIESNGARL